MVQGGGGLMMPMETQLSLDRYIPKPVTERMACFVKLCNLYEKNQGIIPTSPYEIYNFIQDNRLTRELSVFKYDTLRSIALYFSKYKSLKRFE